MSGADHVEAKRKAGWLKSHPEWGGGLYELACAYLELDHELDDTKAKEPLCTCEDLIGEHDTLGKCISSSCERHEWRLVNRVIRGLPK